MQGEVDRLTGLVLQIASCMAGEMRPVPFKSETMHSSTLLLLPTLQYLLLFLLGSILYILSVCITFPFTLFILGLLKLSKMIILCGHT